MMNIQLQQRQNASSQNKGGQEDQGNTIITTQQETFANNENVIRQSGTQEVKVMNITDVDVYDKHHPVYHARSKTIIIKQDERQDETQDQLNQKHQKSNNEIAYRQMDDFRIPLEQLCTRLETNTQNGLTTIEAERRTQEYGKNSMSELPKIPPWMRFLEECTTMFNILLWCGAVLCIIAYNLNSEDPANLYLSFVLILLVLITATISYVQTVNSEALMESFKNFLPQKCTVIRDGGNKMQILAIDLVPGDILEIKMGEKIPADIRIIQSREMKVDNSALTGESDALRRSSECTHNNPLETQNMAFFGTLCKEGAGRGIVVRIADNTLLGNIAQLASASGVHGNEIKKTPLRIEIDHFVLIITILSFIFGSAFFYLSYFVMNYKILDCVILGIGIIVANVPEGLVGFVSVALAITAKQMADKYVLVKDLEAVETLGATSCICSDKTGTLTQNKMTVEHLWYAGRTVKAENKEKQGQGFQYEYNQHDPVFNTLQKCAVVSSEATFDLTNINNQDKKSLQYLQLNVNGDATESALIRFFQPIEDILQTREKSKIVKLKDGAFAQLPFNSTNKFALTIIENEDSVRTQYNSIYSVLIKGAAEKIQQLCNTALTNDNEDNPNVKIIQCNQQWVQNFEQQNLKFAKAGERVLGFAIQYLPQQQYPKGFDFNVNNPDSFNFPLKQFSFVGLISLIDPPKETVPFAVKKCKSAGIKVIMVTGDQPATATTIARQVNIIPQDVKTVDEVLEERNNNGQNDQITWNDALALSKAVVVHGDRLNQSFINNNNDDRELIEWLKKPYCVFARTSPSQKLQIVSACQKLGYIVAVTGDGVNDSPAIKQADIGISMGISGSDVTKDAADMILLNDDFSSIVDGVENGRRIFDNLKKTIVYILASNIVEILPMFAFVLLRLPLPLSCIFMLCIDVGTDILPAISLAYEEAELDLMTRKPRMRKDHLVTASLMIHAYGLNSWIQSSGAFLAYFAMMLYFGFTPASLIGMSQMNSVEYPNADDKYNSNSPTFGNSNIPKDCTQYDQSNQYQVEWFGMKDSPYDLRMMFLQCNTVSKKWESRVQWGDCFDESVVSPVTQTHVCYGTEALKYAQSAYFVSGVFSQIANILCVKCRKISLFQSKVNYVMCIGQLLEVILCLFLTRTPVVNEIFGGRPLNIWMFMTPSIFSATYLIIWEETRKYLIRNWPKKQGESANWFERNVFW